MEELLFPSFFQCSKDLTLAAQDEGVSAVLDVGDKIKGFFLPPKPDLEAEGQN